MDLKDIKRLYGDEASMFDFIFSAKEDSLAEINENDKKVLDDKFTKLNKEYSEIELMVDKILLEKLEEYINLSDEINAYFNSKYYKEGLRNGIELVIGAVK